MAVGQSTQAYFLNTSGSFSLARANCAPKALSGSDAALFIIDGLVFRYKESCARLSGEEACQRTQVQDCCTMV